MTQINLLQSFYGTNGLPKSATEIDCGDELITIQSAAAECDINNILKQYSKTGIINHIQKQNQQWLDLPDTTDYQESLEIMRQARAAFDSLPSKVRDEFANSPQNLLEALGDPAQHSRLRDLGILEPVPPSAGQSVSPSPAAPAEVTPKPAEVTPKA